MENVPVYLLLFMVSLLLYALVIKPRDKDKP